MQLQLVQFYNHTKGEVDTIDKMIGQYTASSYQYMFNGSIFCDDGYWRNLRFSITVGTLVLSDETRTM